MISSRNFSMKYKDMVMGKDAGCGGEGKLWHVIMRSLEVLCYYIG